MSRQIWTNIFVKNFFDYLDVELKVFKKDENKQFRLVKNLTMGEALFFSLFDRAVSWLLRSETLA